MYYLRTLEYTRYIAIIVNRCCHGYARTRITVIRRITTICLVRMCNQARNIKKQRIISFPVPMVYANKVR
ncbi:hypothetical protein J5N97_027786 [Dioscorea zingiberensis]|uniref:Uncharacterized protein n=1 Tax=Dioscorea zingiberensis TaxID=325984 RepID=A0A9D5BXX5_9LILI|nr:hypothetical protein J5N97_027786 [Dioscorea zingiberensis]